MSAFEPIAIIGRGCVLPGCHSPQALWDAVQSRRCLITPPPDNIWGIDPETHAKAAFRGGYVTGFGALFDPNAYDLGEADAAALDAVFQWPLKAAMDAWKEAKHPKAASDRIGIILANLSYPSRAKSDHASEIWLQGRSDTDVLNAFNSGGPPRMIARAIGAGGPAFSLDAACASSLYAIHIACRKLQARSLDIAIAGAVNAADNLMLHRGFAALQALSPSGRSQPFSVEADGLVPAEGAAAIVLKRLADVEEGEAVYGIIRGTGLSNDGRRRGLLAPDETGQLEAMRRAYASADLSPDTIGFLECHATGTPVGDGVEVRSAARLFGARRPLPAGSLKSNTGHLITVAGMASVLKMTSAMRHKTLPPTVLDGPLISDLADSPLRVLDNPEPWESEGPRRTAISNFGFGGNNAHIILEEYIPEAKRPARSNRLIQANDPVVICATGLMAGTDRGTRRIIRRLMTPPDTCNAKAETLTVNPVFARTPPTDLRHAEPQQLAVLDVCEEALSGVALPASERIGVFVGMGCASDATRWLLRERLGNWTGLKPDSAELEAAQNAIVAPIEAADVLGAMPNIPANRLNAACDFRGQGFSVSADGLSGEVCLSLACEALDAGEIDMALLASADFATETVRARALSEACAIDDPADLAAALVLKRQSDADANGDTILAVISDENGSSGDAPASAISQLRKAVYGDAPVAATLFDVAAVSRLAQLGHQPDAEHAKIWLQAETERRTELPVSSGFGEAGSIRLAFPDAPSMPDLLRPAPYLFWTRAGSLVSLLGRVLSEQAGGRGRFRLAVIARTQEELNLRMDVIANRLEAGLALEGDGVYFGEGKPDGEMAFVYTGSAAAYPRMGRHLFMAFPELARRVGQAFPEARRIAGLLSKPDLNAYEQLCAVTLLSQAHTILLRDMLGLKPDALLGLSLGETNSLIAFKFWKDAGVLLDEIAADEMYEKHLGGEFETARAAWNLDQPANWTNWRIYAPLKDVQEAIAGTRHVEITIIYTDEDCIIGGPADECKFVASALADGAAQIMNQHLIVHARAMQPYAETWRTLHTRPTSAKPDIRIYTNAGNCAYKPSKRKVADILTRQAVNPIDFPKTVEQAYADGVRTFVEIGPRDTLALSIDKILGSRPHSCIAADRIEASDLRQITVLAATLFADGRDVDMALIDRALNETRTKGLPPAMTHKSSFKTPAHVKAPAVKPTAQMAAISGADMPLAPRLPPPDYASTNEPAHKPAAASLAPSKPPASVSTGMQALEPRTPRGPAYSRSQLEAASRGRISDLFGPLFQQQDSYRRQVRLPAPPLLLCDRITGIDAQPGIEGKGVIWTETDIQEEAWYMHEGYMQPGPLIEAGQADLSLISYMGADFKNQNERVYRLLGCELTMHAGGLPRSGETLHYQIEITGHATLSGVRMFFFQYDCSANGRPIFSVRNGQAGFFTDEELASGKGVLWDPAVDAPPSAEPAAFDPSNASAKRSFSAQDLAKFRRGDAYACFGEGFETCAAHSRPPRTGRGKLELFDSVAEFDPAGGPWGRGYLKALAHVPMDAWFYDGHFHEDPCMPGTLMAEAAVQALSFYAAALGLTKACDGFVFEPVPSEPFKFICRGQVIPDAPHELSYEVFVDEIIAGDTPIIFAALLATSDGKKVFYCPRFGIRLRRSWPQADTSAEKVLIGPMGESRGDRAALQACANGAPSDAFGEMYAPFDKAGRVPRLPQPPYHMISRILSVSTRPNRPEIGATIVTEYDVPEDAWYFTDNANGAMPLSVLTEVALQPCGWLASHGGFALNGGETFRNLDGEGHVHMEIRPGDGPICVTSRMKSFSRIGPMTIVSFELSATLPDGRPVISLNTSFGFFPPDALASQSGLKTSEAERAQIAYPAQPIALGNTRNMLPKGAMCMLDQVDYFNPAGGAAGLGLIRGRQSVDPYAWYFKAHFMGDPVQPGSLGLDALVQLLERAIILKGFTQDMRKPRFQSLATGQPVKWTYRGQVTPNAKQVTTLMEITGATQDDGSLLITGDGSLWCDGLRIYGVENMAIRLVDEA